MKLMYVLPQAVSRYLFNDTVPDAFPIGPTTSEPERSIVRVRTGIKGQGIMRRRRI
jgi:hypothetical protein